MTLREYLAAGRKTSDRACDFVIEILANPNLADADNWQELEHHPTFKLSSFEAVEAAKTSWRAYTEVDCASSAGAT